MSWLSSKVKKFQNWATPDDVKAARRQMEQGVAQAQGQVDEQKTWKQKEGDYENSLRNGGYDPTVAQRYFDQANTDITAGAHVAGRGDAESYAARGLGESGMAAGAQGDVALQAAAARASARQRSIEAATAQKRGDTLGAWGVASTARGMDTQYQQMLWQRQQAEEAARNQALAELAQLGFVVGGAVTGNPALIAAGTGGVKGKA